jgi:urea transport system permease protein
MTFLSWTELPWYWYRHLHFLWAMCLVVLAPGLLALVFGFFAFRSRIKGVYFSIMTQALTFAGMLLFFRNETGFGGNNGFTNFRSILGFRHHRPGTRAALFLATVAVAGGSLLHRLAPGAQQVRPGADRPARCGKPPDVLRLRPARLQAVRLGVERRAVRLGRARCMCRRWASSTPAKCRRPTPSKPPCGSPWAGAAR